MNPSKEVLIKSLHICLGIPIRVFDSHYKLINEYRSNRTTSFFYNYKAMVKEGEKSQAFFSFMSGNFNEMFLLYRHEDKKYLFGPFRANYIDKEFFEVKMAEQNIRREEQEIIYTSLNSLPLFSLGDIRDILILVHYFFTGEIEDLLHENLHQYTRDISEEIQIVHMDNLITQNYNSENYLYLYENKILEYVKSGNLNKLQEMVFELSNGIIPSLSGDVLRSEKNYSILTFEKLTQTAIFMGMDIINAYQSRDVFIRENELAKDVFDVLQVRDAAIIFYTQKIGKSKSRNLSPFISSVMQYIGVNIHKKITIKEIADYFFVSETKLCSTFKKEMNMTLYRYILKQKVTASKAMLKSNYTISEVALSLGFSDASHFSKVFKKQTGLSPKQYQQSSKANKTITIDKRDESESY